MCATALGCFKIPLKTFRTTPKYCRPLARFTPRADAEKRDIQVDDNRSATGQNGQDGQLEAGEIGAWEAIQLSVQVLCVTLPLSYGGIETWARIAGQQVADLPVIQKALLADANEIFQILCLYFLLSQNTTGKPLLDKISRDFAAPKHVSLLAGCLGAPLCFVTLQLLSNSQGHDMSAGPSDIQAILRSGDNSAITALFIASCLLAPFLEEVVYRGVFLEALSASQPAFQSVLISAALFSGSHFSAGNFVPLLVLGGCLGCIYRATGGSVLASTLAHGGYNAAVLMLMAGFI